MKICGTCKWRLTCLQIDESLSGNSECKPRIVNQTSLKYTPAKLFRRGRKKPGKPAEIVRAAILRSLRKSPKTANQIYEEDKELCSLSSIHKSLTLLANAGRVKYSQKTASKERVWVIIK